MQVHIKYEEFEVEGNAVKDDYIGDPDVTNGVKYLPPYVEDIHVHLPNSDVDLYDYLSEYHINNIIEALNEEANDER